ncbi:MAG: hypothetical protein JWM49_857 [Microbacteriaceae bacterium]|nr:hypothetical protein [Microbacteriaceae bacterium]
MRLWLRDSERRPDPTPATTDDRKAILVGLVLWVVGLVSLLVFLGPLLSSGNPWVLWTCAVGLVLGLIGLYYTNRRHG